MEPGVSHTAGLTAQPSVSSNMYAYTGLEMRMRSCRVRSEDLGSLEMARVPEEYGVGGS